AVAFRPDGRRLAAGDYRGVVKIWDATGAQDALTAVIPGGPWNCSGVAFRADGKQLVTARKGTVHLWDVASRRPGRAFAGATAEVNGVALSADGKTVAAADVAGTVRLWHTGTGRALHVLDGAAGKSPDPEVPLSAAVAFTADSSRLVWADTR